MSMTVRRRATAPPDFTAVQAPLRAELRAVQDRLLASATHGHDQQKKSDALAGIAAAMAALYPGRAA